MFWFRFRRTSHQSIRLSNFTLKRFLFIFPFFNLSFHNSIIFIDSTFPFRFVLVYTLYNPVNIWQKQVHHVKTWFDNKIDKTYLTFGDVGGTSIAKLGNSNSHMFFLITLVIKLFKKQNRPLFANVERFGSIWNITQMKKLFWNKFFVVFKSGI